MKWKGPCLAGFRILWKIIRTRVSLSARPLSIMDMERDPVHHLGHSPESQCHGIFRWTPPGITTAARLRAQSSLRQSHRKGNDFFWSDFCDRLLAARRWTTCPVHSSQPMQSEKTMKLNCHYQPTNTLPVPFSCTANRHYHRIEVV